MMYIHSNNKIDKRITDWPSVYNRDVKDHSQPGSPALADGNPPLAHLSRRKDARLGMWYVYYLHISIQSNPLKWIALGPEYEYPLRQSIHVLYSTLCLNGTRQIIFI